MNTLPVRGSWKLRFKIDSGALAFWGHMARRRRDEFLQGSLLDLIPSWNVPIILSASHGDSNENQQSKAGRLSWRPLSFVDVRCRELGPFRAAARRVYLRLARTVPSRCRIVSRGLYQGVLTAGLAIFAHFQV